MARSLALCFALACSLSLALAAPARADDIARDPSWSAYSEAVHALTRDVAEARRLLAEVIARDPAHPAAEHARRLVRVLDGQLDSAAPGATAPGINAPGATLPEMDEHGEPDGDGRRRGVDGRHVRPELAMFSLVQGAALGAELCVIAGCDNHRQWLGASLASGAVGIAASMLRTRDGISAGRAHAIKQGGRWGTFFGYTLFSAAGTFWNEDSLDYDTETDEKLGLALAGGQLGGIAAALILDNRLELTEGEAAMMGTGALVTASFTTVTIFAAAHDNVLDEGEVRALHAGLAATAALGLGVGGRLGRKHRVTRGRAMLLDAGSFVGMGVGAGLAAVARGDDGASGEAILGAAAGGTVVGFGITWLLTRSWKDEPRSGDGPDVNVALAPTDGGALATVHLGLR